MSPVEIASIIQAVSYLTDVVTDTISAIDKMNKANPNQIDVSKLKAKLLDLPDLTTLFPEVTKNGN